MKQTFMMLYICRALWTHVISLTTTAITSIPETGELLPWRGRDPAVAGGKGPFQALSTSPPPALPTNAGDLLSAKPCPRFQPQGTQSLPQWGDNNRL